MTTGHDLPAVAVIGLGAMGRPMARRLLAAGHPVHLVAGRAVESVAELTRQGAAAHATPAAAARVSDVVLLVLPDDAATDVVLFDPDSGVLAAARPGLLVVDASTTAPTQARSRAAALAAAGTAYVDAPLSGGPGRAETGELTVMLGGSDDAIELALRALTSLATRTFATGEVGTAQVVKACNNLLIAAITAANAEALALGVTAGVDLESLHCILTTCTGTSWQLENVVPRTVLTGHYEPGYALRHMLKDLSIISAMADQLGLSVPVTVTARSQFAEAAAAFGDSRDFSVVTRLVDTAPRHRTHLPTQSTHP